MKKYRVFATITEIYYLDVEAQSKKEALEMANETPNDFRVVDDGCPEPELHIDYAIKI